MILRCNKGELEFIPIPLQFNESYSENVFSRKSNKSLTETLQHHRYSKFRPKVERDYSQYKDWSLGKFLLQLKLQGDKFYLQFLNKYGDLRYSTFWIDVEAYLPRRGLYMYTVDKHLKYVGRCKDTFKKRINHGYGKIHPKNCYIDGQATNCHLNALITDNKSDLHLFVYIMEDSQEIEDTEKELIIRYKPPWNIML